MTETHAPSPAALSEDTKHALDALLNAGGADPKLAEALGQAVRDDVEKQRYGEAEARAYLRVYNVAYPDKPEPKKAEHHEQPAAAHNDKPKAKS